MIWAGIAFVASSLFDLALVGTAVAFFCSRPKEIVSVKRLAAISLAIFVVQDIVDWIWFTPLELTITTTNETLIRIFGSSELASSYEPSYFSIADLLVYLIKVAAAVLCGRYLVGRYYKKCCREGMLAQAEENDR